MNRCVFILLTLLLSSCVGNSVLNSKAIKITPGMSADNVLRIIGNPRDRQFNGKHEAWQWCSTGFSVDFYVLVWLTDGIVTGMQSYKNTSPGFCSTYFRTVNWEEKPDQSIEIRQR